MFFTLIKSINEKRLDINKANNNTDKAPFNPRATPMIVTITPSPNPIAEFDSRLIMSKMMPGIIPKINNNIEFIVAAELSYSSSFNIIKRTKVIILILREMKCVSISAIVQ